MKTQFLTLLGAVALAGFCQAGSDDSVTTVPVSNGKGGVSLVRVRDNAAPATSIALVKGSGQRAQAPAATAAADNSTTGPASNGKGGTALLKNSAR